MVGAASLAINAEFWFEIEGYNAIVAVVRDEILQNVIVRIFASKNGGEFFGGMNEVVFATFGAVRNFENAGAAKFNQAAREVIEIAVGGFWNGEIFFPESPHLKKLTGSVREGVVDHFDGFFATVAGDRAENVHEIVCWGADVHN